MLERHPSPDVLESVDCNAQALLLAHFASSNGQGAYARNTFPARQQIQALQGQKDENG